MTADGKARARGFAPAALLSPANKFWQQALAGADAVMSGSGTAVENLAAFGLSSEPLRVIVSNSGNLDPGWKGFKCPGFPPVVFSTRRMPVRLRSAVARKAELFLFSGGDVDLRKSLEILRSEFGVKRLVCEGGGTLFRSLASLDLVDRICLAIAPAIFGGLLAPTLTGLPGAFLDPPSEFEITRKSVADGECLLELRRKK